jgi:hypothetical protein
MGEPGTVLPANEEAERRMRAGGALSRRRFLASAGAAGALAFLRPFGAAARPGPAPARPAGLTHPIPSSGEALPLVGLGTWITFNVGDDPAARDASAQVMAAFFEGGGRLIDSSPMYGSSQDVVGYGLQKLGHPAQLFAADKVWVSRRPRAGATTKWKR